MSKKHIPYFKFFPSDFMHGVRGLSAQEVGIYMMLLCRIYEENGPVEFNTMRLATYCGMREMTFIKTVGKLIDLGKIDLSNGVISNRRAMEEISSRANDLKINSKAGKASAEKRQQKQSSHSTDVERTFNHTDTDTDIKEEKTPKGVQKKSPKSILEEVLSEPIASAVVEHRAKIKKPLTERAAELLAKRLSSAKDTCGLMSDQAADLMIEKGWQSFEAEWAKNAMSSGWTPEPSTANKPRPDSELSSEELSEKWNKRMNYARNNRCWFTSVWGPMPGLEGCEVPEQFLQQGDGFDRNGYRWIEQSKRAA